MFKDEFRGKVWNEIRQHNVRAFAKQLTPEVFTEAARRAEVRIGCSALNLVNLVWLAIAKAIHHSQNFAFVLTTTLKLLEDQESFHSTPLGKQKKKARRAAKNGKQGKNGKQPKHYPYRKDPTEVSEEAFVQARQRMPLEFWAALLAVLAERFQGKRRVGIAIHRRPPGNPWRHSETETNHPRQFRSGIPDRKLKPDKKRATSKSASEASRFPLLACASG